MVSMLTEKEKETETNTQRETEREKGNEGARKEDPTLKRSNLTNKPYPRAQRFIRNGLKRRMRKSPLNQAESLGVLVMTLTVGADTNLLLTTLGKKKKKKEERSLSEGFGSK